MGTLLSDMTVRPASRVSSLLAWTCMGPGPFSLCLSLEPLSNGGRQGTVCKPLDASLSGSCRSFIHWIRSAPEGDLLGVCHYGDAKQEGRVPSLSIHSMQI